MISQIEFKLLWKKTLCLQTDNEDDYKFLPLYNKTFFVFVLKAVFKLYPDEELLNGSHQ